MNWDAEGQAIYNDGCEDANEPPEEDEISIVAKKIVCENESSLPNYGAGGPNITETTASDWVEDHEDCELVDWDFEWAYYNEPNPGNNDIGPTGGGWNVFSGSVNVPMPDGTDDDTKLWVREVVEDGYIPFSEDTSPDGGWDENSAEIYCHTDVLNYDNYDRIDGLEEGGTYNCVAWNVPENFCEPIAAMPIYARIKLNDQPDGWRNWNAGNVAAKIFVGGNTDMPNEAAGNVYDPGEWFLIYDGLNYIVDPAMDGVYDDVPGIAVERLAGSIRVVLYGTHAQPEGNQLFNREYVRGSVQFSNDGGLTHSSDAYPTSLVKDLANPWDFQPGNHMYHPGSDKTNIFTIGAGPAANAQFKFVVTTGNDGFYTNYTHTPGTPCPEEEYPQ
jgi:hypothetical protein